MGWFWADTPAPRQAHLRAAASSRLASMVAAWQDDGATPPPSCPMHAHAKALEALSPHDIAASQRRPSPSLYSARPGADDGPASHPSATDSSPSVLSQLNPLNHMFRDLPQARAPDQTHVLPTTREASSIPRGGGEPEGNWEYPSPQQMYNALLRKGYADTDVTAVESMVAVHNFLNEGAWAQIIGWEDRFRGGLAKGWQICRRGEENSDGLLERMRDGSESQPRLVRFQGRPGDMTPRAVMLQVMGMIYPSKFGMEPPFDRHDWFVARTTPGGQTKEIRYVIDYYSAAPDEDGNPVFVLDVRPAATPTGAAERIIRWGSDVWWRASGGVTRE